MKEISRDSNELRKYLFRAFCWLQSPQHPDAVVNHLGLNADKHFAFCSMERVAVSVIPLVENCDGRPGICFESYHLVKTPDHLYQPFNREALDFCRQLVQEFCPIYDEWNGYNKREDFYLETFSISPNVFPSRGVRTALLNYQRTFDLKRFGPSPEGLALLVKPLGWW